MSEDGRLGVEQRSSAGFQPAGNKPSNLCRQDACATRIGGTRLLAVVTLKPGEQGRHYRLPTNRDYDAVWKAQKRLKEILDAWERDGRKGLCPVPDEPLPPIGTLGFRVQRYGMLQWGDLFTARQKVAMVTLSRVTREAGSNKGQIIALFMGKVLRHCNVVSKWHKGSETVAGAFGLQALPMSWDFPEMFPMVAYVVFKTR